MHKLYSAILLLLLLSPASAQVLADWTFDKPSATYAPGEFGNLMLKLSVHAPDDASLKDYQVSNIRTSIEFPPKVAGDLRKQSTAIVRDGQFLSMEHAFSIDPVMDEGSYPFSVIVYYDEQYTDPDNNPCCQQVKVSNSKQVVLESPTRAPNYIRVVKLRQNPSPVSNTIWPAAQPVASNLQLDDCEAQTQYLQQKNSQCLAELNACEAEAATYRLANKVLTIVATLVAVIGGLIILGLTAIVLVVLFLSFCALGLLLCVAVIAGSLLGLVLLFFLIKALVRVFCWAKNSIWPSKARKSPHPRSKARARRRARARKRRR